MSILNLSITCACMYTLLSIYMDIDASMNLMQIDVCNTLNLSTCTCN